MSGYILLVDDNPHNLRLLIAILRERGYQIRPATNGMRALDLIAREKPDLVLLDINMPGMDGYQVCARLKADESTADLPVLFISASDDINDKLKGFAAGAVDYITKPFQEAEVLARISAQMTIQRQRRQLESVLDSSQDGIMACEAQRDSAGGIVDFRWQLLNPAVAALLGKSRAQLTGQTLSEHLPGLLETGLFADFIKVVETGQALDKELYLSAFKSWVHVLAVKLEDGLVATIRDTSERKRLELELARLAERDGLTGIANRRMFDARLAAEWQRCGSSGRPLSLLLMDIDYFKRYNDSCGHLEGDRCLAEVAQALASLSAETNADTSAQTLAARYGGEEFVLILPDSGADQALSLADVLMARVRALELRHPDAPGLDRVSLSIGVACLVPELEADPQSLVLAADRALYRAKAAGRNRSQLADVAALTDTVSKPVSKPVSETVTEVPAC